ncbi:MAG: ATP-dependent helicase [PS1 clade bacterium]|uniref:DEAD-box ATP-dependent RNA helicase RhpA n=1 Tax=PS1 clade bacterium TaxID=2175152 RepID=A0A368DW91_9PROT|nr:MAG: ATP-dependent helicase [PS1 clade bacterium]HAK98702.1 RNA helicase [Rhodobiaceae bacterium]|tara:strand:+ start:8236 stop:9648 length:1413 start_codon:yes stop_codon:yes gene_type:complete
MKFDELGLAPEIMTAINDAGYTTPTPIQAEAIPHVIAGRDVLGIAQTGTGKTASFTLPMIHRLMKGRAKARMPRTLILEPTRELAAQVADNFDVYGKNTKLTKALLIGGVSFGDQEKAIMRGADVLIATPGRLLDHVERGGVLLRGVEVLVIDEADRMLDMGFIPDIERIVKLLPFTRQTLFFSATMPPEITRLTQQFLSAPARVEVAPPSSTNDNVSQRLISVPKTQKLKTLKKLFDEEDVTNGIIFCNRKRDIGDLLNALQKSGYPAVSLHGDMDQHMRLKMLDKFKGGEATYLIASDVAARGLDIPAVSHVFNYDVPTHAEDYVHRIGRTGRAGRKGAAITLFSKEDGKYIDAIEKLINRKIDVVKSNDTPDDVTTDKEEKAASKPHRKNDGDKKGNEKGERKGLAAFSKNKRDKKENSDAIPKALHANDKPVQKEPKTDNSTGNASDKTQVGFGENIPAFLKNAPE